MTAPVRSASASPFAAVRPQVHSRRVSLRVGSFGLTYSTNRLLWEGLQGAAEASAEPASTPEPTPASAPVDPIAAASILTDPSLTNPRLADPRLVNPSLADPPPVDAAPAVESERPQGRAESSTFPLDLEAARSRAAQAAKSYGTAASTWEQPAGPAQTAAATGATAAAAPGSPAQGVAQTAQAPPGNAAPPQPDQAGRKAALAQAMRATKAYLACAAGFVCPRPMLQAVA